MSTPQNSYLPLTPLQQGIWLETSGLTGDDPYVLQLAVTVAALDADRFEQALDQVVAKHSALRACFRARRSGEPVQVVVPAAKVPVQHLDLSGASAESVAARLDELRHTEASAGFDLARPPLLRCTVVALPNGDHTVWFTCHHIVIDGWSMPLFVQRVFAAYAGEAVADDDVFVTFLRWLAERDMAEADAAYAKALEGLPGPTTVGEGRSADGTQDQAVVLGRVDARASERLLAWARAHELSLSAVVEAAWARTLSLTLGVDDVVFGTVDSGRSIEVDGVGEALGAFANTVPVRVRVGSGRRVRDVVSDVQEQRIATLAHRHVGLGRIQQAHGGEALFDTLLTFQNYRSQDPASPHHSGSQAGGSGVQLRDVAAFTPTTHATTLTVVPGGSLEVTLTHRTNDLDPAAARAMLTRLITLLEHLPAAGDGLVAAWSATSDSQTAELAERGSHEPALIAELLPQSLLAAAERFADRPALVWQGHTETYAELFADVVDLAVRLRGDGAVPGRVVSLLCTRGRGELVAHLAVLLTGAAYHPIDVRLPRRRVQEMIDDSKPALLVATHDQTCDDLGILVRRVPERIGGGAPASESLHLVRGWARDQRPGEVNNVIFTSGSTGRPKGVLVTKGAMANIVAAYAREVALTENDVVLGTAATSFDISAMDSLVPLTRGATVVLASQVEITDLESFSRLLRENRVDVVQATPAWWTWFVDHDPRALLGVRVVTGGEALGGQLAERLVSASARVLNVYGPTEATVWSTACEITAADVARPMIGGALPGNGVRLLDADLKPVPDDCVGEIYLCGPALARGYLQRPALTAARFIADPYGAPGSRMYRTGDLGRHVTGSGLECLGRVDHQVKVRGHRIECGAVERALMDQDGVRQACVQVRPGAVGGAAKVLVAHVAPAGLDDGELRRGLAEVLAPYEVPGVIVQLDALPVTSAGKVDRAALLFEEDRSSAEPSPDPRVTVLRELFAEVLGGHQVDDHDDFFAIGGDSIGAARLAARASSRWGALVPVRAVLEHRTPVALAAALDLEPEGAPSAPPEPRRLGRTQGPMSPNQASLWFLEKLAPSSRYNVNLVLDLQGELDVESLDRAVTDLVTRHEILRTTYHLDGAHPVQRVTPAPTVRGMLKVIESPATIVDVALATEMNDIFDLEAEPPFRATLHRCSARHHVLLLSLHHIAFDGGSAAPLAHDLITAYRARLDAGEPRFADEPLQYLDYVQWQGERLGDPDDAGSLAARQLSFWGDRLRGLTGWTGLPSPRPTAATSFDGRQRVYAWGREVADAVDGVARAVGCTRFAVYQVALAVALHGGGAALDQGIGTPVGGRPVERLERSVGYFTNTVVSRITLDPRRSFRDTVAQRGRDLAAELDHQDVPFDRVVRRLNPERTGAGNELFQTVLVMQNQDRPMLDLPGLTVQERILPIAKVRFDLTVAVVETAEQGATVAVEYALDRYDEAPIVALVDRLHRVLLDAAADPSASIADLAGVDRSAAGPVAPFATEQLASRSVGTPTGSSPTADDAADATDDASSIDAAADSSGVLAAVVAAYAVATGQEAPDPDVSFFDLGGHSIAAVGVAAVLADHRVDVGTIMKGPSARELTSWILRDRAASDDPPAPGGSQSLGRADNHEAMAGGHVDLFAPLLPIRPTGGHPALFCIHGGAGFALPYTGLASAIDAEVPVWGLQTPALTPGLDLTHDMSAMAQVYLGHVRRVQPHGPYRLLGWSYGGFAAHEVARHLEAAGEEVDLLVMIDAIVPDVTGIIDQFGEVPELPTQMLITSFSQHLELDDGDRTPTTVGELHAALQQRGGPVAVFSEEQLERLVRNMQGHGRLVVNHKPGQVTAPTLLVYSASHGTPHSTQLAAQWEPHLQGPVTTTTVEAEHEFLMHPLPQRLIGAQVDALLHPDGNRLLRREPRLNGERRSRAGDTGGPDLTEPPPSDKDTTMAVDADPPASPPASPPADPPASSPASSPAARGIATIERSSSAVVGRPRRAFDALGEVGTLVVRRLRHVRTAPGRLIGVVTNPLIMIVGIGYLFASALVLPGYNGVYMNYLLAGVAAQTALANVGPTGVAIRTDSDRGIMDRFRSLPIGRAVVLVAHSLADTLIGVAGLIVVVLAGFLAGWRPHTDPLGFLLGCGLMVVFTHLMVWIGILVGMVVRSVESIDAVGAAVMVGLSFLSNALLAPNTMPRWVQPIAEWNPVSAFATALRRFWGNPVATSTSWAGDHPLAVVAATALIVLVVCPAVALRRFRDGR